MANIKEELREEASRYGIDLFGVASAHDFGDAPSGHRPTDILPGAESIIILGLKMLDAQTDLLPLEGDSSSTSPRQAMFSGHNAFLSQRLDSAGYDISRFLEKKGFRAYHQLASTGGVDGRFLTGLLSLKHIAAKAGIGIIGKSSLLVTPRFGPRVRLAAVVTDAKIEPDEPLKENFCSECSSPCISQCPASSLQKPTPGSPYQINRFACQQYLTTRPTCSICLKVCPVGDQRVR
jgi:epoxyqueuosine reductase